MTERLIDQLKSLTESVALAGAASGGRGRYSRTPDFTAPSARSTRPRSDRGLTFHFSHKVISKRNDISENNYTQTTSAAHQGYIERPSATALADDQITSALLSAPTPEIEDSLIADGFTYPERVVEPGRASFGTLGTSKAERKAFWNDVELYEGKKSRVQSRIIAELPHEFSDVERAAMAGEFCQMLEERGLPYWATIHTPGPRNDAKNYHLHITYFDRPSGRRDDGTWAHAYTEIRTKKSRNKIKTRPALSAKHPDTRLRDWPKKLRRNFADTANFHLAIGGYEKRHDPRSYRDSGIEKEPTEHLGNKVSALESMGLDTEAGRRNAKREIRWRIAQAEAPWMQRYNALTDPDSSLFNAAESDKEDLLSIASEGISTARKSTSLKIVSDLMTHRVEKRKSFLKSEVSRLSDKKDMSDFAERSMAVLALSSEEDVVVNTEESLRKTARKTRSESERHEEMNRKLLKLFDKRRRLLDPDLLFDEQSGTDMEEVDDTSRMSPRPDPFDTADMKNIEDLFGDSAQTKPRETGSQNLPRIEEIIRDVAAIPEGESLESRTIEDAQSFPEAWSIQSSKDKADLLRLDESLAELDNRALRHAAIATRDATDLSQTEEARMDFARGWAVLRFEAERRGLDLDTGQHRPEDATDAQRALLHADQEPCSIRVVRKNIARQRVR